MKFQPGDKVSFINEKQEGIVKKVLPGNRIIVEIEDGFEIPALENELVKRGTLPEPETENSTARPVQPESAAIINVCEENSICFAAIPEATGAVQTGPLQYVLVNRSPLDVAFTIFVVQGKEKKGLCMASCPSGDAVVLARFTREELTGIQSFIFQGLLYSHEAMPGITHLRDEWGVFMPDFRNARREQEGNLAFAVTRTLYNHNRDPEIPVKDLLEKFNTNRQRDQPMKTKRAAGTGADATKYGVYENEKEVDLHIEELVADFSGMSNADMLQVQLKHFSMEMDQAIRKHFKRIVFIHGVGNGRLKNEIRNELRSYSGVAFRDGDHRKYGNGATEVLFV